MYKLSLQGITDKDRASVIWDLKETLRNAGAWIINFQLFSNKAIGVHFEVYFETISHLGDLLFQLNIGFPSDSRSQFDELSSLYLQDPEKYKEMEISGFLNVCFEHNDPELIITVPMVPG